VLEEAEECSGDEGGLRRDLPVEDTGQLAVDLIRLAAEVLEYGGRLDVLDRGWVERHVRSTCIPNANKSAGNGPN
jgi:hypothetical protein